MVGRTVSSCSDCRERSAERGDRRVRIVTLAVHEPVDEPLNALPHRLEADGHDTGHDEREEEVAAGRECRADHPTMAT